MEIGQYGLIGQNVHQPVLVVSNIEQECATIRCLSAMAYRALVTVWRK